MEEFVDDVYRAPYGESDPAFADVEATIARVIDETFRAQSELAKSAASNIVDTFVAAGYVDYDAGEQHCRDTVESDIACVISETICVQPDGLNSAFQRLITHELLDRQIAPEHLPAMRNAIIRCCDRAFQAASAAYATALSKGVVVKQNNP